MTRESVLAHTMVELADNLVDDFDVVDLLTTLAARCVEVLDVSAAGLMLVDGSGQLQLMCSSSDAMRVVELFEIQSQEGPCPDCFRTGQPVVNHDLTSGDDRWPVFGPVAVDAGFRAVDAIPMRLRGQVIGALNLFRVDLGSMGPDDVLVAQAFADVATIAILQNRSSAEAQVLNAQLSTALASRIVIEQAKGIIAERQHLTVEEGFVRLRRYARDRNLRLADVARDVVFGDIDVDAFSASPAREQA